MMKKTKYFLSLGLVIGAVLISCKSPKDALIEVTNSSPRYGGEGFVKLVKIYDLDVTQISLFGKQSNEGFGRVIDFDRNNNMYILDSYESKISVFNDSGGFMRSFGRAGQGPRDFSRPSALVIENEKILVFEGFNELKIVGLKGEFISKQVINIENRLDVRVVGNRFFVLRGKTDPTFTSLRLILTAYDDSFVSGKDLFRYDYPPGLRGLQYNCLWWNWLLVSRSGEFYFPEDNLNVYSIIKYDKEGKPILKFSRDYVVARYSKEAHDNISAAHEKRIKQGEALPQSPPVVVNIFQDDRRNVWVISGETYEDNMNPEYENTVDIFNENGEWLYSFKTRSISKNCFCQRGRIYQVSPINLETYDQKIEVYRIAYH